MKGYSSKELIDILTADGWHQTDTRGDHCYFKHTSKPGKITVPQERPPAENHSIHTKTSGAEISPARKGR